MIFAVSDHGPGISSEIKDKVFDWFESETQGTRHRGAGLGLSIVRSFVELHGGKVRIEFGSGGGYYGGMHFSGRGRRFAQRRRIGE